MKKKGAFVTLHRVQNAFRPSILKSGQPLPDQPGYAAPAVAGDHGDKGESGSTSDACAAMACDGDSGSATEIPELQRDSRSMTCARSVVRRYAELHRPQTPLTPPRSTSAITGNLATCLQTTSKHRILRSEFSSKAVA